MSQPIHSTNSATNSTSAGGESPADVRGSTTPRVWTPPLVTGPPGPCVCGCALTPDTSYGFEVIRFAERVLGTPLDPWEQWSAIHGGELLPDGRPRFRVLLIIVARQNGKTLLARVLILYWMFVERLPQILGTSTDRSYAKKAWRQVCDLAQSNRWLRRKLGPNAVRLTISEEAFVTLDGSEYGFAANNRRAGRSMTLHRWVCDELREHTNWEAWKAATNAQNAVAGAQTICITNMGDDTSVVLDSLRTSATEYVETGVGDPRLGIQEWSAPPGSDPTDLAALAMANPNLGYVGRVDVDALRGEAIRVVRAGGLELAGFRTEVMCQRVHTFDAAIDPDMWTARGTDTPVDLAEHRHLVALCLDVSLAGDHASLLAAAVIDGVTHLEVVEAWDGYGCTKAVRADLPGIVARVRPRVVGWFPRGPAAVLTADMQERRRAGWPPRRVKLIEIGGETAAVCMGFAEQVMADSVQHPRDPMLTAHATSAAKLRTGDRWVFTRRGAGPVDGLYAAAGATHLARTLPPLPPPLSVAKPSKSAP